MRDNVHQSRNKISRVLVGAALVATLGLPSAAQAQAPAAPTVTGTGDGTTTGPGGAVIAKWGGALPTGQTGWLLEHTEPGVAWDDATKTVFDMAQPW